MANFTHQVGEFHQMHSAPVPGNPGPHPESIMHASGAHGEAGGGPVK